MAVPKRGFSLVREYAEDFKDLEQKRFRASEEEAVLFKYFFIGEDGQKYFAPKCPVTSCGKPLELIGRGKGHCAGLYGCPDDFIDPNRPTMGPAPHCGVMFMWDRMKTMQAFKPGNEIGAMYVPRECGKHTKCSDDIFPLQQRFSAVAYDNMEKETREKIRKVCCDWGDHRQWLEKLDGDQGKYDARVKYFFDLCEVVNRAEQRKYNDSTKAAAAERGANKKKTGKFFSKISWSENNIAHTLLRSQLNANMIVDVATKESPYTFRFHCSCPKSLCVYYQQLSDYPGNSDKIYRAVCSYTDKSETLQLDLTCKDIRDNVIPYDVILEHGYHLRDGPKRMYQPELDASIYLETSCNPSSSSAAGSAQANGNLFMVPVSAFNAGLGGGSTAGASPVIDIGDMPE